MGERARARQDGRRPARGWVAAWCLLACACQHPFAPPLPLDEAIRAELGSVAVVAAEHDPVVSVSAPFHGGGAGLGLGLVRGLGFAVVVPPAAALSGGLGAGPFGLLGGGILGAAAAAVYFPVSIVGGVMTIPERADIERAAPIIEAALAERATPERLAARCRDSIATLAGRPTAPAAGADTLVELRLDQVFRGRSWDLWTLDRAFEINVAVTVRVVREDTQSELYRVQLHYSDPLRCRTFAGWAADDGDPLRGELDHASDLLAEKVVEEVFLVYRPLAEERPQLRFR